MSGEIHSRSHGQQGLATSVITELVRPNGIPEFEDWARRANEYLATAEGFVGINTIRADDNDTPRYVTLIHFDSQEQLDSWNESPEHQRLLAELQPLLADSSVQRAEGLEIWYSLPKTNRRRNPSYWRQVLLVTPVVFVLILISNVVLVPLESQVSSLALLFLSVLLVSMTLTWPVMPWVTKVFRRFLYPDAE
ncbi:MAG: antibiotic biosynthesis monooxygenase [Actinomycetota bacterium]|nr:antibiotic biosynthesis monooxygenase [Actinomycetota bacterium]